MAQAFIRASEDSVVGANQHSNQLKAKFYENYKQLILEVHSRCGTPYGNQTQVSAFNEVPCMPAQHLSINGNTTIPSRV